MKTTLTAWKITYTCLIVALFWNIAATQQLSIFTSNATVEKQPRDIVLACGLTGHWATIQRFNKHDADARGYDPSYTVIYSRYHPVVQKVGEVWQITFYSEISQNIP